jgi:hypothetical protein
MEYCKFNYQSQVTKAGPYTGHRTAEIAASFSCSSCTLVPGSVTIESRRLEDLDEKLQKELAIIKSPVCRDFK